MGEFARQLTWSQTPVSLFHYHDREGREVDVILKDKLGPRMHAGYVLYCGDESVSFGDGIGCLPISALWAVSP